MQMPCMPRSRVQDFDWTALGARRMEPPRKPQEADYSKRKAELEESHRADPELPTIAPHELAECDKVGSGWLGDSGVLGPRAQFLPPAQVAKPCAPPGLPRPPA